MLKKHDTKFYAFRIFLFINVSMLFGFEYFHDNCMAVIGSDIAIDYGVDKNKIGVLSSVYFYIMAVMQLVSGCVSDVLDPTVYISIA
ncbi:MAG: hypothetical protein MJ232_09015 [archaeon]|nr:hypothetical protein [archaeon]